MRAIIFGTVISALGATNLLASTQVRVVDGDTLEVAGIVYRLHGMDAPEAGQTCNGVGGGQWQCGKEAIATLEELALGNDVTCDNRGGMDLYGRTIGVCKVAGKDINAIMIETGHAWAFRRYSQDYAGLEDVAHKAHLGVWQADTETPWDYRAHKWEVAKQEVPDGCPIKGNISKSGHIYHAPWSPWYAKTKVNVKNGERWFCSEKDAMDAGWRAPYWGR